MIVEILVSALLVIGGFFGFVGSYGLVKLPDAMTRLHGPTKAATLGVGSVLIASLIWTPWSTGVVTWHELLITLFLFLTAPVTGNVIAKANMHTSWRESEIPRPPEGHWSTYGSPVAERPEAAPRTE